LNWIVSVCRCVHVRVCVCVCVSVLVDGSEDERVQSRQMSTGEKEEEENCDKRGGLVCVLARGHCVGRERDCCWAKWGRVLHLDWK